MQRPREQLNPVLFALANATAQLDPVVIGMLTLGSMAAIGAILAPYLFGARKDQEMKRWEAAVLFVMLSITSAIFMIPFGNYAPALVGFAFMVTINDKDLPRHVFNTISGGILGGLFTMFNTISGRLFTMFNTSSGGLFTCLIQSQVGFSRCLIQSQEGFL